ncbi:tryptophan--tRNA ligase [Rickettsia endosymbiont of Cardiosporidium cionae]|uniref:tryptophan--tRNA ligase n=1 Tax=Rickettsia endosymbiont of Cardiosporidium cionae TaxID=2777155 RepID=UPI00189443F3|nr:tryptophan--tRNA ligase [Rickettsia endosymbiont of Cardiosporidium cionae]KAF8818999.1 tryptophan--tRNA ligase [Rickettsia endosymbiont of Cardiosporidium cionae]
MKKHIVSGIQPSGAIHIGNYLGAIKQWINLQNDFKCFIFLADLHSMTANLTDFKQDKTQLLFETLAIYIASGIDYKKSTIFLQSTISEHTELAWLLNCITPIGKLKRMTQFKSKSDINNIQFLNTGILTYPLLMAADILLYKASYVPVGNDQTQHLEFARDIASIINKHSSNHKYSSNHKFPIPEATYQKYSSRIMSLKDGTKKMSKSDISEFARINICDSADLITKKIQKSKTDSIEHISYEPKLRPEITNLINIYSEFSSISIQDIVSQYENKNISIFKQDLSEIIINKLQPLQSEYYRLISDKGFLSKIIDEGQKEATKIAHINYQEIKNIFGLYDIMRNRAGN